MLTNGNIFAGLFLAKTVRHKKESGRKHPKIRACTMMVIIRI